MSGTGEPVRQQRMLALLKALLTAVKGRSFYPSGHPTVMAALRELGMAYDAAVAGAGQAAIGRIGRNLVADGDVLSPEIPYVERFSAELAAHDIEKLTFLPGAAAADLEVLVETLATPRERLREEGGAQQVLIVRGVRGVQIGRFALEEQEAATDGDDLWRRARATWERGLEGVRGLLERVRSGRAIRGGEAREIAAMLIHGLSGQRGPMLAALSLRQKSPYTFSHSLNVALLMLAQVEMLPLTGRQLEEIAAAGLLHDLGKLQVPEKILNKPAPPTDAEWEALRWHPVLGAEVLSRMRDAGDLALIVAFEHHRRHDGTGYPECRRPWPLSQATALATIADSYDALSSQRPYDPGWPCELVHARMMDLSGTMFHPGLLERFFRIVGVYPPGTRVRLGSGAIARVVRNNPAQPCLPLVKILRDPAGAIPEADVHVDLSLEPMIGADAAPAVVESLADLAV